MSETNDLTDFTMNDVIQIFKYTKDKERLICLSKSIGFLDLKYIVTSLGQNHPSSLLINEYLNTCDNFTDSTLEKKSSSMNFTEILSILKETDSEFLINTGDELQAKYLDSLRNCLETVVAFKNKNSDDTEISLDNKDKKSNKLLPVLLHKDAS